MILHENIRQIDDPVLRQVSMPLKLEDKTESNSLIKDMRSVLDVVHTRYDFSWSSGISAIQIGKPKRICLIWLPEDGFQAIINPVIINQSETCNLKWEGCLSFFDKRGKVERPDWIEVTYFNQDLEEKTETFENDRARILSHEIDHMDGILYIDRMKETETLIDLETYKKIKKQNA